MKHNTSKSDVQGEGDYVSAKKYNEQAHSFADSGQVEKAAKNAAPRNAKEDAEMRKAEAEGRSHAKGSVKADPKNKSAIKNGSEQSPGRKPDEKRAPPKGELGKPIPDKLPIPGR